MCLERKGSLANPLVAELRKTKLAILLNQAHVLHFLAYVLFILVFYVQVSHNTHTSLENNKAEFERKVHMYVL